MQEREREREGRKECERERERERESVCVCVCVYVRSFVQVATFSRQGREFEGRQIEHRARACACVVSVFTQNARVLHWTRQTDISIGDLQNATETNTQNLNLCFISNLQTEISLMNLTNRRRDTREALEPAFCQRSTPHSVCIHRP